jgi:hypothetical protein
MLPSGAGQIRTRRSVPSQTVPTHVPTQRAGRLGCTLITGVALFYTVVLSGRTRLQSGVATKPSKLDT